MTACSATLDIDRHQTAEDLAVEANDASDALFDAIHADVLASAIAGLSSGNPDAQIDAPGIGFGVSPASEVLAGIYSTEARCKQADKLFMALIHAALTGGDAKTIAAQIVETAAEIHADFNTWGSGK